MRKNEHPRSRREGKPASASLERLSARSRQVMDILYRLGEATANQVLEESHGDIPSYSAVRSILRQLVNQGRVEHEAKGLRYVYRPTVSRESQSRSALAQVLDTFFDGSPERTMQALLDLSESGDYDVDLRRFEELIKRAKKEGR